MKKIIAVVLSAAMLTACATAPDKIQGAYVSPMQYSGYDCDQIRSELLRVSSRVREVAGAQKAKADSDAIAMGVGLFLFWPALFFLANGSDRQEELARLKGDYDALEQAAIQKKCPVAQEIRAGR